jgi:threonine/homoserine/homoserine lactone efflux protein
LLIFVTMDLHFLFEGILIGGAVSVPLGPLGMLCVQRTVNKNWEAGLLSGLGIAIADTLYAVIAGFSLSIIIEFIRGYEFYFKIIGLLVLVLLGIYTFNSNPTKEIRKYKRRGSSYVQDFITTFLIALTNPLAIFAFLAIFSGYSIVLKLSQWVEALMMIAGIFIGATFWWIVLTGFTNLFRHKFTINTLEWANKIIGIGIIVIALGFFFFLQEKGI